MSVHKEAKRITTQVLHEMKQNGERIAMQPKAGLRKSQYMYIQILQGLGAMMIVGGVREGGVERDASRNRMKLEWAC